MTKPILKKEIRFAVHIPKTDTREDMHYVKEQVTYKDGTIEGKSYLVQDYKRPIWVTNPSKRNHKDKKEFEDKDNLITQSCTQSDLTRVIAGLLGTPNITNTDTIKNSPYVYGYDISSTSIIKYTSLKKNDFIQSPYTVAAYDIETNPEMNDTIVLITVAFGEKIHTSILASLIPDTSGLEARIHKAINHYLPQYGGDKYKFTFTVCKNELEVIADSFKVANDWAPDILAIWNMNFDIPKILDKLKQLNANPIDYICDLNVPRKYRVCRYKQGISKKITASGVVKPIPPSLQWHSLICTSKFYVLDAMCVYRQLRMAKQEEPSYSLNAILQKELNVKKLSFSLADQYSGIKWHLFLQEKYPIEYIVYNIYDCLSMLELDAKIKDLTSTVPSFAGISDFARFNSNPKKITDALFLFGVEKGRIIGTVPKVDRKPEEIIDVDIPEGINDDEDDEDEDENKESTPEYKTLDLKGWIQLLPQNLLVADGLKCLEEYPNIATNIRGLVCDQDASSAYPSCTLVANVSKETCVNELISIDGIPERVFREQNLSVCLGPANMLEYFTVMFGMPSILELEKKGLL